MNNRTIKKLLVAFVAITSIASCSKKLDLFPQNELTPEKTYSTIEGYKSVLAKVYGGLAMSGNTGPYGLPDIGGGLDEGSQVAFIRAFFNHQELPTDEAIVAWNDQTIQDFHAFRVTAADGFVRGMYARPIYNITMANEFLRESADDKVASRGITGADADDIRNARAEVRFLRAFNYWVMMDLFGTSTFITEEDEVGSNIPKQIERPQLFEYIESELKAIDGDLAPAKTIEYGRVDQAAAWALLARMYLNAAVYTGTPRYSDAITYSEKVINAGYTLSANYSHLFMADNDKETNEMIFAINCDGLRIRGVGNTTFFLHAASKSDFPEYGTNEGWAGYRGTLAFGNVFADKSGTTDKRALFTTSLYNTNNLLPITDVGNYDQGLHIKKYINIRTDGLPVADATKFYSDIDFPVFRLAEMYLIYAEAVLRNGGGAELTTAVNYINKVRARAYGTTAIGQINTSDLNLQFVLDERARELYWEGHRRTDLIRYNQLTTNTYLWPWKGGVASGTAVDPKYNLYPIPATNRTSNPNLTQNPGY